MYRSISAGLLSVGLVWRETESDSSHIRSLYVLNDVGVEHLDVAYTQVCWCEAAAAGAPPCTIQVYHWTAGVSQEFETSCPVDRLLPDQPRVAWGTLLP